MNNTLSGWGDTIAAIATPPGVGAIAVLRISGAQAISIAQKMMPSKKIIKAKGYTVHFGALVHNGELLDEVLLTIFRNPKSFTGEDVVEISCHGSIYIQNKLLSSIIENGARLAKPGEFTQRAFLNGKMDLSQAEAVADLIAADSGAAQRTALNQMRGGFSSDLKLMREELINFAALLELELDFSEEDVEFADRSQLNNLVDRLRSKTQSLIESFKLGNAIKNGVSVAIIGKPNAGKSTLLNSLLNEDRAIVSEIAGTTRDVIEEALNINGLIFRLIDTAGIREHSTDVIEKIGMERSRQNAAKADIILYLKDLTDSEINNQSMANEYELDWLKTFADKILLVHTKYKKWQQQSTEKPDAHLFNSLDNRVDAKDGFGVEQLKENIYAKAMSNITQGNEGSIVTNVRHFEAFKNMDESLAAVQAGLQNHLSGDLLTIDIRQALHYLGEITGQVEIDRDILGTIFGKFCIGK